MHAGLSWSHGCLVVMVLSLHQTTRAAITMEGPLVGWAIGLGSFSAKEEDGSTWGQVLSPGAQKHLQPSP